MGNTAKQCRLGLFQDSDFARDLEDSKCTSGGTLCFFGSHTFWMCKKQTSVSHSSTESEIISLDTGEGAEKAPGREKTHKALTNQLERPSEPRSRLPDWVRTHEPEELVVLDGEVREESSQLQTWRSTRPSWHVCRTFEASPGCDGNHHVRQLFCQGLAAVRLGRMTALQKPDGGVRGIIVGDYFRRLVSRTLAKAICAEGRGRYIAFPARTENPSRVRVCRPHGAGIHRVQ